ncbi:uncharacterized protein LOC141631715 [Silene latifolia]|uniref:uncharacterized protein LOC141631715 n=1 Tax=Silene latifolia TaxID=37657 RepID=UPI003D773122
MGENPPWEVLEGFLRRVWIDYKISKVSFLPNGLFVVRFDTLEHQKLVLPRGMVLFDGKPVILRHWDPVVKISKVAVKVVPIWIKLVGLDLKFWGAKCLEKLAALVGKYVRIDNLTVYRTNLGFARVMVEVEIDQTFPDKIRFLDELGNEVTVLIEYDWLPITCGQCKGMGHIEKVCMRGLRRPPPAQPKKPLNPVKQVRRPKLTIVVDLDPKEFPVLVAPMSTRLNASRIAQGTPPNPLVTPATTPIPVSHSVSFTSARFITKMIRHETRIANKVQLDVLEMDAQFIHLKVTEVLTNKVFYVTYVYGFNKIEQRVPLWNSLIRMNMTAPWIVMGDFNCVMFSNERIGSIVRDSEMAPFYHAAQICDLQDIKAIGAFYTWTNKQPSNTRVFSRIDRVLINGA